MGDGKKQGGGEKEKKPGLLKKWWNKLVESEIVDPKDFARAVNSN